MCRTPSPSLSGIDFWSVYPFSFLKNSSISFLSAWSTHSLQGKCDPCPLSLYLTVAGFLIDDLYVLLWSLPITLDFV